MNVKVNSTNNRGFAPRWLAPALLLISSLMLGLGYNMHLAGFIGWMTLLIAGASLFVAGGLWGDLQHSRFGWLALGVALVGATLCLLGLPAQLRGDEMMAAGVNALVILSQLGAAFLIWRATSLPLATR
ncbi:MAG: hypothetical protein AAF614_37355 [Chloroflexota bacterium]